MEVILGLGGSIIDVTTLYLVERKYIVCFKKERKYGVDSVLDTQNVTSTLTLTPFGCIIFGGWMAVGLIPTGLSSPSHSVGQQ